MLEMNTDISINNINYLRFMEERQKQIEENGDDKIIQTLRESEPDYIKNRQ